MSSLHEFMHTEGTKSRIVALMESAKMINEGDELPDEFLDKVAHEVHDVVDIVVHGTLGDKEMDMLESNEHHPFMDAVFAFMDVVCLYAAKSEVDRRRIERLENEG